jgi:hypothetical protein
MKVNNTLIILLNFMEQQSKRKIGAAENNPENLRIEDLEVIKLIVETKIKEM